MARELKPVSFNTDTKVDKEILEYIEDLGVPFGSYVKLLIRKDMKRNNFNYTDDESYNVAVQLKELVDTLKNINVKVMEDKNYIDESSELNIKKEIEESKEEKKQRMAIENLLNMGK